LYGQLPPGVLKFDWVVNIKPVGNGQAVLKYLAPYVYRVAICDNRIHSVDEQGVTYPKAPTWENPMHDRINELYDRMVKLTFGPAAMLTGSMASDTAAGAVRIQIDGQTVGTGDTFQRAFTDAQRALSVLSVAG